MPTLRDAANAWAKEDIDFHRGSAEPLYDTFVRAFTAGAEWRASTALAAAPADAIYSLIAETSIRPPAEPAVGASEPVGRQCILQEIEYAEAYGWPKESMQRLAAMCRTQRATPQAEPPPQQAKREAEQRTKLNVRAKAGGTVLRDDSP